MCGIAGIVSFAGGTHRRRRACAAWRRRSRTAGPDAEGVWIDARAAPVGRPRPPPALHHRPLARGRPAARQRGRHRPGHAERRDLQLRGAARGRWRRATASARTATPRPSSTATRTRATRSCARSTACSRWRCGTRGGAACCWPATPSARSRSTTGHDGRELRVRLRDQGAAGGGRARGLRRVGPARVPGLRLRAHAAHAVRGHPQAPAGVRSWSWTRTACARRAPYWDLRVPAPDEAPARVRSTRPRSACASCSPRPCASG